MNRRIIGLGLSAFLVGCGVAPTAGDVVGTGRSKDDDGKFERWGTNDAPSLFSGELDYHVDALPDAGEATAIPWASSYWPVFQDSINFKWDGTSSESSSKKYERAFGGTGLENAVSQYHGIDAQSRRKQCTSDSQCASLNDGSACAKRAGATKGRCIPTWWGVCHAWAPASIMLPEPKHPVTRNGVTFKVMDLKALVTLVHNKTFSKFVSLRCEGGASSTSTISYDGYGRPTDPACKDSNAGTYHVLLANYLGLKGESFVEDRTFNYEVWNQPLRGYRFTQKLEVTAAQANQLLGVTGGGNTTTQNGSVARGEWKHFGPFAVEPGAPFRVQLSGNNDADLYVNFGSQPTSSVYACRPYSDTSDEMCDLIVPAGQTQAFVSVNGWATNSSFTLKITSGGSSPDAYAFNDAAARLFHVKAEVDYISEADSSTDGNLSSLIDTYTRTDRYEYILEVDAAGLVIGGEWIGPSKSAHPDFLWLPTGVNGTSVAGGKITYANVKSLLDESVQ